MLKVFQIIDSLDIGGAERMAVNMANAFSDNCIENVVCVTRLNGAFRHLLDEKIPYFFLNKKHVLDMPAFIRLIKLIARYQPTVIHAHSTSYLWAILAKLFFRKVKLVWHDHRGWNKEKKYRFRPLLKFLSGTINGIVVVDENLKQRNLKQTSVPEQHIKFIKNFPDIRLMPAAKKMSAETNILCLANLRPEKNHSVLLAAFAKVVSRSANRKLNLWLAGRAFNPQYEEQLVGLVQQLGIVDQVRFLGNVQNTQTLLSQAHIGVLCSAFEGLPVSLLEYGLAELPVLVTDVGHCREVVGGGACGWLVPSHNVDAFADALQYMIEHMDERIEKGKLLKERVIKEYGANRFVTEYLSFLRSLKVRDLAFSN